MLLSGTAVAQSNQLDKKAAKKEMDAPVGGPVISFERTVVDYGEMAKGAEPLRKFEFVNEGTEPLIIKSAKGSCGCTVPDYPKHPIMPGETGAIEVRYDTQREGMFTKTVTITTNASDVPVILTIKGKVNPLSAEESVPAREGSIF